MTELNPATACFAPEHDRTQPRHGLLRSRT